MGYWRAWEILGELGMCNRKLIAIRVSIGKDTGETKSKLVYMAGCALILYNFSILHIPTSRTNLIITSPIMLKWKAIPQYKSILRDCQAGGCWSEACSWWDASPCWLKDEVSSVKPREKRSMKKDIEDFFCWWERAVLKVRWPILMFTPPSHPQRSLRSLGESLIPPMFLEVSLFNQQ